MAAEPLIVIVGPTASGKSALALDLAERYNGEIICADSRTVYRGMDIGTAKPSKIDQARVPHHLIDIVDPKDPFTVAEFKRTAEAAITDINNRGKLPILVGGSGLYIDTVLYGYQFSAPGAPRSVVNPRHREPTNPPKQVLRAQTLVVGLEVEKEQLIERIANRIRLMFEMGLVEEAKKLADQYSWEAESMKTYLPLRGYIEGSETLEQASEQLLIKDRQLAKKQRTWFKRNKSIQWVKDPEEAVVVVTTYLNKSP